MPIPTDEEIAQAMRAKSTRSVLGEFLAALGQLVIHLNVPAALPRVSVNFHGAAMRVDIATLTEDGQHLEQWVCGLNANPVDPAFGSRVSLPTDGPVQ